MKTIVGIWYLAQFFLEWEMFQTNVVQKIKTHILCSITFSSKSCGLWGMWKNMVGPDRPQMTKIRRIRVTCWVPKATDTHWEYVILAAFPWQQWLGERASMLLYTLPFPPSPPPPSGILYVTLEISRPLCPCHAFCDCWLNCCTGHSYLQIFVDLRKYCHVHLDRTNSDLYWEVSCSNPACDTDHNNYSCKWFSSISPSDCRERIVK